MLIGELSQRTGVHAHQLRYYEAQGLLEPGRGTNGYREYTDDAIVTVTQIRKLLDAGLSTQEIGFLQPCTTGVAPDLEPCPDTLETLRARLHGLDEQIDALIRSRQTLHDYTEATEQRVTALPVPGMRLGRPGANTRVILNDGPRPAAQKHRVQFSMVFS